MINIQKCLKEKEHFFVSALFHKMKFKKKLNNSELFKIKIYF